jgi:hypothetical protein
VVVDDEVDSPALRVVAVREKLQEIARRRGGISCGAAIAVAHRREWLASIEG